MFLSEVEFSGELLRDGEFAFTLHPLSNTPGSLCYALGGKFLNEAIKNPAVSCIITTSENAENIPDSKGVLLSEDPQSLYYRIHEYLVNNDKACLLKDSFVSPTSFIHSSVEIKGKVIIEDDVVLEKDVIIEPNAIIRRSTYIGNRVIIGSKGMQNLRVNNQFLRVAYAGGVEIGERVEVLDTAVIQRPYNFMFTSVGSDSKVSIGVNVGHGSKIGNNTMIAGSTQIAGNVTIGNDVWIGPSVTIADGLTIGNKSRILIGSVVVSNVQENFVVSGNFAMDHNKQLKNLARVKKM
jgi:UDP-3-O-[3-hydroxymyristoyl] glucosamine N-acyltransferase